jgi:glycine dehydrogenase
MTMNLHEEESFQSRHIGPGKKDLREMLDTIRADSLDELIDQTVPESIRLSAPPALPKPLSEYTYLDMLSGVARKNRVCKSFIGLGFYDCIVPPVIQRNILENPGWYTQYTPYQAEISQGRLEALLNFQTMVMDLTGMEVANASLLDEGTAAAEAMAMAHGIVTRRLPHATRFFVSTTCFPQTIDVIRTRARPLGIELVVGDHTTVRFDSSFFGAIIQYPAQDGAIHDIRPFIDAVHTAGGLAVVAADLLSLAVLTPPGEFGADIVIGNSQRFGVPLGFGGPHAAFFATRNEYIRSMPGRIIGVSIDAHNNRAYRMTLQTREQHIRREKATSNICTAQALLAIMAGMYAAYHGPEGLVRIARRIHGLATSLAGALASLGYEQRNKVYFDTLLVKVDDAAKVRSMAEAAGMNFRSVDDHHVGISLDETTDVDDIRTIARVFAKVAGRDLAAPAGFESDGATFPSPFNRKSAFMTHPIFHAYRSELEMMRYLKSLENKDLSLTHSMIPLGSCTMKLNAASELMPISWREFSGIHPFAPADQVEGYREIFNHLEEYLCSITGLAAASLQPNSGAQGEYTGCLSSGPITRIADRSTVLSPSFLPLRMEPTAQARSWQAARLWLSGATTWETSMWTISVHGPWSTGTILPRSW